MHKNKCTELLLIMKNKKCASEATWGAIENEQDSNILVNI